MKAHTSRWLLLGFFFLVAILPLLTASTTNHNLLAAAPNKASRQLLSMLQSSGSAQVIVQLYAPVVAADKSELAAIAALQHSVLDTLNSTDFILLRRFESLPAFTGVIHGNINGKTLNLLQADPRVASIIIDEPGGAHLSESIAALRADIVSNTYGITGAGVTVAVLDTGIDTTHIDLKDSIVAQHCFTANNCQPGDVNESNSAQDLDGHGTHISGIITGDGKESPHGFATNAKIVAVKVLQQPHNGRVSDWIAGLDWLNTNFSTLPVDIVNMSLGTSTLYDGNCDVEQPSLALAIHNLRAKGVVFFASSGNEGSSTQIASPACNSGVIAVGATYDSNVDRQPANGSYREFFGFTTNCFDATTNLNTITCFTNSNSQLDLLAPGAPIRSTALGGNSTTLYGTSQASATAAGVAALMLEKDPSLTPDEIESLLKSSGIAITDVRNRIEIPRISAITAVNAVDFFKHIAPKLVTIGGPSSGVTNASYSFTANVAPISATLPITYSWTASGTNETHTFAGDISASATFHWSQPGIQVVTVTAANAYGSVISTHSINLNSSNTVVPLESVEISGANSGVVNRVYDFTATVAPQNTSLPVTYRWQATGQTGSATNDAQDERASFSWSQPGRYVVTVTASNPGEESVSDTLEVEIESAKPQSISLKGPASGAVNQSIVFLASVLPAEAETPMTYTWRATAQAEETRTDGLNDSETFSWSQAGTYEVSVTVANRYGSVSASRVVVITAPGEIVPITDVSLIAPLSGGVNGMFFFTATVSPAHASSPITYLWESLGQVPIEQVTGSSTSITLSWSQPGTFPITVTASNAGGSAIAVQSVEVLGQPQALEAVYLPIISR